MQSQPIPAAQSEYVVFAWNDLGMHCLNPTYDRGVILPPYNDLFAQVIRRGNPPVIVTSGIEASYEIQNNTFSYGKRDYGQFWDNCEALFGVQLEHDTGLNLVDPDVHNGLSGTMLAKTDHFEADGIPLTPVDDAGTWNPYQIGQITIRAGGQIIAQTQATVPTSDEIRCDKCHGGAVDDYLQVHDEEEGTTLQADVPVLCASCHASPALGATERINNVTFLSEAMHKFHAAIDDMAPPACYDCHPGSQTKCNRSLAHTADDGNCTTCHGTLAQVGGSVTSGRMPWVDLPTCGDCHDTGIPELEPPATRFRDAVGHGGVRCSACHGSPHAMVPSREPSDNYQSQQTQTAVATIGTCKVCHQSSHGGSDSGMFAAMHGGSAPAQLNACHVCHTELSSATSAWPHSFQWTAR